MKVLSTTGREDIQPRRYMGMGGQHHAPAALPPGKTRYPLYRKLGRAGLDGCEKSRPPRGFDPRTVQPVASRYTDCAIPALFVCVCVCVCDL